MIFFWLFVGMLPPSIFGWFLVRNIEGPTPVLFRAERIALGFLTGTTLTMFLMFLAHISLRIPFSFVGFAGVQAVLVLIAAGAHAALRPRWKNVRLPIPPVSDPLPRWARILAVILGVWVLVKLAAGLVLLTGTPVYFDDVFNNWNMRGKIFFVTERLALDIETGNDVIGSGGVNSYPPTIPMLKMWLAKLAGRWEEGLVNAPHILWYLCIVMLFYFALRRRSNLLTSMLGTLMLTSIPLLFMHGTNPYADGFLAAHIFAAVSLLFAAFGSRRPDERNTFFRLGALATAALVFTKNESLLLHIPPILLLLLCTLGVLIWQGKMTKADALRAVAWYGGMICLVLLPWLIFKWMNGLPFGNAKGIPGFVALWQPGIAYAMYYGLFFEANWMFFFPLLILGCLLYARRIRSLPDAVIPLAFFLIVFLGQLPLYLFTGLATEALRQTGYARGIIQILPVGLLALVLMYRDLLEGGKQGKR